MWPSLSSSVEFGVEGVQLLPMTFGPGFGARPPAAVHLLAFGMQQLKDSPWEIDLQAHIALA